jgi:D-glycero-D-manno-heptose 1,7-bisphosphate phosphatase
LVNTKSNPLYAQLVDGVGCWLEPMTNRSWHGRPALFLDRDGVVVEEIGYLRRARDVRLIDGAAAAIRWANETGIPVAIVTNQAGIGRGYFDWPGFVAVQAQIEKELKVFGAHFDLVAACAYHEDAQFPYAHADHPWRKPNPGMLEAASGHLCCEIGLSLIVGDKLGDLAAGAAAGVSHGILVTTGHGAAEIAAFSSTRFAPMSAATAPDLAAALAMARSDGWAATPAM